MRDVLGYLLTAAAIAAVVLLFAGIGGALWWAVDSFDDGSES